MRACAMLLMLLTLGACAANREPPSYSEPPTDGMRPGGGMMSGESGEFVIYRR